MKLLRNQLLQPVPADRFLSIFNPLWSPNLRGAIQSITPLTPTSVAITIRPNHPLPRHRAGQFVSIGIEIDGVRHHRTYSVTNAPSLGSGTIDIAVQAVSGGLVSSHLTQHAHVGDLIHLAAPAGEFTLPDQPATTTTPGLLFVTAGSGITPVIAMLRELELRSTTVPDPSAAGPTAVLVHFAPSRETCMFSDELGRLEADNSWLSVTVVHTRSITAGTDAQSTRLSRAGLDALCPDWLQRNAYVCGPTSLVDFATDQWDKAGALEQLHLERFTPISIGDIDRTEASLVTFARSSVSTESDRADNLLELAEQSGVLVASGCRTGVCHTCTTRLMDGCVQDLRDGRLHQPGSHVQICVSRPTTDVVLDA